MVMGTIQNPNTKQGADVFSVTSIKNMKLNLSLSPRPEHKEKPKTLRECILEDLEKTKYELETAYCGFDNVTDPDLIDCYIYEVNAVMKRYRYLLNQAAALSPLPEEETVPLNTEAPIGALVG